MGRWKTHCVLASLILAFVAGSAEPAHGAEDSFEELYESYLNYLGNHPADRNPGWSENVQGLTHDDDSWFITQAGRLWSIPVQHDLNSSAACGVGGVSCKDLSDISELSAYNHFGDLSYYKAADGRGYLVIPLTGSATPAIGFFDSETLAFVGADLVSLDQDGAGWCAVDPDGFLYSSSSHATSLIKYLPNWHDLRTGSVQLAQIGDPIPLLDENGASLRMQHMQGGVSSPSGRLLYLTSGYWDGHYENDGINVFDTQTWRRVIRSTNGSGHFNYAFNPGYDEQQEVEGVTIWDWDTPNGWPEGVSGQLHVLMNDVDLYTDDVYVKHYTNAIYVDSAYAGSDEQGNPEKPFRTLGGARELAWDGAVIKIAGEPGGRYYPEALSLSKRVGLFATGGPVVIGE